MEESNRFYRIGKKKYQGQKSQTVGVLNIAKVNQVNYISYFMGSLSLIHRI